MTENTENLISHLVNDQISIASELSRRINQSESTEQALLVKIELLRNAIDTALHGTVFDDFGNRDDDGLIPFGRTDTAVTVLQEALNLSN